jgi:two-component system sensor histidine kinase YesM
MINKGHISWSLFSLSFIRQEKEKYISLARSIFYPPYSGERLATFIISITQRGISEVLSRQGINSDFVYICTLNSMEEVFIMDKVNTLEYDDIINVMKKINGRTRGSFLYDLKNARYLLSYYLMATPWSFNGQPLIVLHFTDYQHITDSLSAFSKDINYGMLLFLLILTIVISVFSWTITHPIRRLDEQVKHYARTREIQKHQIHGEGEIATLSRTFFDMQITINELFDKLKKESEIREQYRFQALRAQINPHFLFNTLNTIRWMTMIRRADNITDTIDALVKILEYSIKGDREFVHLGEELDMIRNYLHIQNCRYGDDLMGFIEISPRLEECRIIKFILQPIVENSFLHAFKNISREKIIRISGMIDENCLKLFVQDNGIGILPEKLSELNGSFDLWDKKKVKGIGLPSVYQRIKIEHGETYGIRLKSIPGEGTTVEYTLPLIKWDIKNEEINDS